VRGEVYTGFWCGNLKKRPLERHRHRWEDIKMDLQDVVCGGMDWIDLARDLDRWQALVNACNEPSGSIKCGEFLD
jgi:hypothetical protein